MKRIKGVWPEGKAIKSESVCKAIVRWIKEISTIDMTRQKLSWDENNWDKCVSGTMGDGDDAETSVTMKQEGSADQLSMSRQCPSGNYKI